MNANLEALVELASDEPALVFFSAATALCVSAVIAIAALSTVRKIVVTKAVERSRREIAAYVAEGSISPNDAERLLRANATGKHKA